MTSHRWHDDGAGDGQACVRCAMRSTWPGASRACGGVARKAVRAVPARKLLGSSKPKPPERPAPKRATRRRPKRPCVQRAGCAQGHPFVAGSYTVDRNGARRCHACTQARAEVAAERAEFERRDQERREREAAERAERRRTHCASGHERSVETAYRHPSKGLRCRVCAADHQRAHRERKRLAELHAMLEAAE